MERIRCDLCGADETATIIAGAGWQQAIPEGLALVRCRSCGLLYLNPRPTAEEIGLYYPADYPSFKLAPHDERWQVMRWIRQRKLARRRQLVQQYSACKTGRVLDVGCATGLFLDEMARAGWRACGVEPTAPAAAYARDRFGLEVTEGTLADASYPRNYFDAVTFWDVLEHTFSPSMELARTAELLRPGGLVAINIPNWQSLDRRLFGPHWIGFDPPRHLYVFTRATLTALLQKAGFTPVDWVCFMPSYYPFVISLERWLEERAPRRARLAGKILNLPGVRFPFQPFFSVADRLRMGGVIAVFAVKVSAV